MNQTPQQRVTPMTDVARIPWPANASARSELRALGTPRLLIVDADASIPITDSPIEDWAWASAPERELSARQDSLRRAATLFVPTPVLDDAGILDFRSRRVALPPVEARLVQEMIENFGSVVSRDQLSRAAWGPTPPGRNALDVHILRIRRRVEPVSLAVKTVRSRGYLLEAKR